MSSSPSRPLLLAAVGLSLLLSACATTPPAQPASAPAARRAPPTEADVDALVGAAMREWSIPGVAVAVVKDGQVVLAKGYGVQREGEPTPVDADTLFGIASNTKPFTATAVALLVQEGKVKWDDAVTQHLPWFALSDAAVTPKVQVRDLLSHRVGLATFGGDILWFDSVYPKAEVLKRLAKVPLESDFRSRYGYSNLMFLVAGELVEKLSGASWERFCADRIARPLGMDRTTFLVTDAVSKPNLSGYHTRAGGKWELIPPRTIDAAAPAASMHSSANDMAKWMKFVLARGGEGAPQLLAKDGFDALFTPQILVPMGRRQRATGSHFAAYGLGWFLQDRKGHFLVSHAGGMPGMLSLTTLAPEEGLGVVVLTNADENPAYVALSGALMDAYLGLPAHDWVAQLRAPPPPAPARPELSRDVQPADFAGTYRSEVYGDAVIVSENGQLVLRPSAHPQLHCVLQIVSRERALCPWNRPEFGVSELPFLDDGGRAFTVQFRPDYIDPVKYTFRRVAP